MEAKQSRCYVLNQQSLRKINVLNKYKTIWQMRTLLTLLLLIILTTDYSLAQNDQLNIKLMKQDTLEIQTKNQLLKLMSTYDIKRWVYTKEIVVESGYQVIPRSHPILTLNTRHLKDDYLLLSTFVHEQLHWFMSNHQSKDEVLVQLKSIYPNPKIDFPDGSGGEIDTYFHIIICYLEYKVLKKLLGDLRAYQIMIFWKQDHYKWIYTTVLDDQRKIEELVKKFNFEF